MSEMSKFVFKFPNNNNETTKMFSEKSESPHRKNSKRIPRGLSLLQQCAAVKITWSEMTEAPQPIRGIKAIHLHVSAVASWPPFRKGINYRQERKVLKSRKVLRAKNVIPFLQYAPAHPSSALLRTTAFQGNLHLPKMAKSFNAQFRVFR